MSYVLKLKIPSGSVGASVSGGRVVGGSVSGAVVAGVVASVVGAAVSVGVGAAPQALQESKIANVSRQIKRLFMVFPPNFVNIPIIPLCNPGIKGFCKKAKKGANRSSLLSI